MDVDEDEDATQRPKKAADYGIEVDFDSIEDDERDQDSAEVLARYDKDIANTNGEIERMAPNMKAMDRYVLGPGYCMNLAYRVC
jgi:structural maintenance of chromosome 1